MKLNMEVNAKIGNIDVRVHDIRSNPPWLLLNSNSLQLNFKKYECYTEISI